MLVMKKMSTLLAVLLAAFSLGQLNAQTTTWDFTATAPSWSSSGSAAIQIVDNKGLGLYGNSSGSIVNFGAYDASSSATWGAPNDAYTGTARVKTNGAGFATGADEFLPTQRYFFIQVNQACTVKVWFKSGSGGAARSVIVSSGTANYAKVTSVTSGTGLPSDGGFVNASVTTAGTFYIYGDAAVNIYQIQVVGATVSLTPTNPLNATAPVKFGAINLSQANGFTKVDWNILSEINTDKYFVERSDNGVNFAAIGSLKAINASKYTYMDNTPLNGLTGFYRIKAVDKDGSIGYSSVVKIGGKKTATDVTIAPNPVKGGQLNVQLNSFEKGTYSFNLYDASGKMVFSKSVAVEAANAAQTLQLPSTVPNGVYQLQVTNGTTKISKTVMVQ
jgi:hypothetical protein